MFLRCLTTILLLPAITCLAVAQDQTQLVSRFQPNTVYSLTITVNVNGTDGYKDITPSTTVQRVEITTGALTGGSFPAEMTIYSPVRLDANSTKEFVQWKLAFSVTDETLGNMKILASYETMEQKYARSVLHRYLSDFVFAPAYALETGRDVATPKLDNIVRRDGSGELYDFTYTLEIPPPKEAVGAMVQHENGYGQYDAQIGFFPELVKQEMTKIYQYEDASGEENHIVMNRETKFITHISTVSE